MSIHIGSALYRMLAFPFISECLNPTTSNCELITDVGSNRQVANHYCTTGALMDRRSTLFSADTHQRPTPGQGARSSACQRGPKRYSSLASSIVLACILATSASAADSPFPAEQRIFMEMLTRCSQGIRQLANPIQREMFEEECRNEERSFVERTTNIRDWNGVVRGLRADGNGDIRLLISTTFSDFSVKDPPTFGLSIFLGTFPTGFRPDIGSGPVIDYMAADQRTIVKGSPVYNQLASVNVGDLVSFSGSVEHIKADYGTFYALLDIQPTDVRPLVPSESSATRGATPAQAAPPQSKYFQASFDCSKAATSVEVMICSDENLADRDMMLGRLYQQTIRDALDPASVRQSQRLWLSSHRNKCKDIDCIASAYRDRYAALQEVPVRP
jgi:uncharacterized protein YecT (DUF1311 family)